MTTMLFTNNAKTTLAVAALNSATQFTVATGSGSLFPVPATNQVLVLTLNGAINPFMEEIVYCTAISGDVLTVTRAQEGTIAQNWNIGDFIVNLMTAGTAQNFLQVNSGSTSNRPVPTAIGQFYYDTTLGYPVYCNQITPSIVWHNSQGGVV